MLLASMGVLGLGVVGQSNGLRWVYDNGERVLMYHSRAMSKRLQIS